MHCRPRHRDAGHHPPDIQHPGVRRQRHDKVIDRRARQRRQQHGPAPVAVGQRAQDRREDELHGRVRRDQQTEFESDVARLIELAQQAWQDGQDQPDAHGIEREREEDDDKGRHANAPLPLPATAHENGKPR